MVPLMGYTLATWIHLAALDSGTYRIAKRMQYRTYSDTQCIADGVARQ